MGEFTYFFVLASIGGFALGIIIMVMLSKFGLNRDQQKAKLILEEANIKADSTVRQAILDAKTQTYDLKLAAEKEIKESRQALQEVELKLNRREDSLNFRSETLTSKEKELELRNNQVTEKLNVLEKMEANLKEKIDGQVAELERIANMSSAEAKNELMDINEEMKGRIIGREGRNIRAIEQATGVDILIDDTPETITLSCFDPIRREVARLALETLLKDGRIQPGRIEEVVTRVQNELNETIQKAGEDAVFKVGVGKVDREIVGLIGRLRYRYSYGQNALQHSMEVAHLTGMMAAELGLNHELGLNQTLAKRVGLLHDIGKALDFEMEGSHIELGARICRKHGEHPAVVNGIESHHGDVPANSIYSILVQAADTLSAARPGARFESFQNYIQRLEQLEKIATSFDGVDKVYAIQAGREIRVMVVPDKIDDLASHRIAREIREKIENEMTYPGQIKVTVIRETRHSETAK